MQIFWDIVQGSQEWLQIRAGLQTASRFNDVTAKRGPRGGEPKTRTLYLYQLAGEILTGEPMETYSNKHMQRGQEREAEARRLYSLVTGNEAQQVGFIRDGNCGCSPDSLIGDEGLLEIKDALPHIQIARLLADELPAEHKAQCQGQLKVTKRSWVDFMSHCRGLPPFIKRVYRDEKYIAALTVDINQFDKELKALVKKIRSM